MVEFFVESNKLKRTKRYSVCPKAFHEPVAGHSWHMAIMIPLITRELKLNIDILHALEIAIVHDLPEYVLEEDFDSYLVASGVLSKADKNSSEETAMSEIKNRFDFGKEFYSLWKEYEENKTSEARFVKAMDRLESHMHVIEIGTPFNNEREAEHQVFYADEAVKNFPELKPLLKATKKKLRPILEKSGLTWKSEYDYPD